MLDRRELRQRAEETVAAIMSNKFVMSAPLKDTLIAIFEEGADFASMIEEKKFKESLPKVK